MEIQPSRPNQSPNAAQLIRMLAPFLIVGGVLLLFLYFGLTK